MGQGDVPPLSRMAGPGGTVSRKTPNKKYKASIHSGDSTLNITPFMNHCYCSFTAFCTITIQLQTAVGDIHEPLSLNSSVHPDWTVDVTRIWLDDPLISALRPLFISMYSKHTTTTTTTTSQLALSIKWYCGKRDIRIIGYGYGSVAKMVDPHTFIRMAPLKHRQSDSDAVGF